MFTFYASHIEKFSAIDILESILINTLRNNLIICSIVYNFNYIKLFSLVDVMVLKSHLTIWDFYFQNVHEYDLIKLYFECIY